MSSFSCDYPALAVEVLPSPRISDATPDQFAFANRNGVATGSQVTSDPITVTGIDEPAGLSIAGVASRSYSINGGPFVKTASTVNAGDTIRLRLISAATANTARTATLTIGNVSATWRVRTGSVDTTADLFTIPIRRNVNVESTVTSPGIVVAGINAPTPISVSGASRSSYNVNGGPFVMRAGTVSEGDSVRIRHAASAQLLTEATSVLNIGGARGTFTSVTRDTRTYQDESIIYLERRAGDDIQRVGMRLDWGSSIVEVSLNGTNFVNAWDTGREVQLSIWDSSDIRPCSPEENQVWCGAGWSPTQGGDYHVHGSPTVEYHLRPDSIYVRSLALEWYPDNKGGGSDEAVTSDVQYEQWLTLVKGQPRAFKVHSRITHLGDDHHRAAPQEMPAVYCNLGYDSFVSYAGSSPWTNDATSSLTWINPDTGNGAAAGVATERWGGCVDPMGVGMTIYVPHAFPGVAGFRVDDSPGYPGSGTNFFRFDTFFDTPARAVIDSDFYILPGDFRVARSAIYELRHIATSDFVDPQLAFDAPAQGEQVSGTIEVAGWAWDSDDSQGGYLARVRVLVDGQFVGLAELHRLRLDVAEAVAGAPPDTGYVLELDTTDYANGPHSIRVVATDKGGNTVGVTHRVMITN